MNLTVTLPSEDWQAIIDICDIFVQDHNSASAEMLVDKLFTELWKENAND